MKGVQCYELFGGIALKNHAFSFFIFIHTHADICINYIDVNVSDRAKQWEGFIRDVNVDGATLIYFVS